MKKDTHLIQYENLKKNINISYRNSSDVIASNGRLYIAVELIKNAFKETGVIGVEQLSKFICDATQKTNYKYESDCGKEGRCAYCLTIAEHVLDAITNANQEEHHEDSLEHDLNLQRKLFDQGVWYREIEEILSAFRKPVTEDDLDIVAIYSSAYDLGVHYVDNYIGSLNPYLEAVLDYSALGENVAENNEEFMLLESGRIIEFPIKE